MQHPRGEDAIRLTVHIERRTGETEVEQDGSRERAATGDDDGQRNGDIDDQQRLGGDRVDDDRTSVNLLAARDGALRTMEPHRCLGHAGTADRPVASLAENARAAVFVPVAVGDLGRAHEADRSSLNRRSLRRSPE